MGFKELFLGVPQNSVWDAEFPKFFQALYIYDVADEHFDFPTSGENVCGSRTFINQP